MTNKEEIKKQTTNKEELENVAGGGRGREYKWD